MKEIGGYFYLEEFQSEEYHHGLIAVSHARAALLYVLRAKRIRKLYLPNYLCGVLFDLCKAENMPYECYCVDADFLPLFDRELQDGESLYVVNYFGQLDCETIQTLKAKHHNLIMDNVQAFFQEPIPGVDTLYSCRKFFGVPDGGYLATDATLESNLPIDVSMERMRHLLGRLEGLSAKDYYAEFKKNDATLDSIGLRAMSKLTNNLLRAIDYETVKHRREENYNRLHDILKSRNMLALKMPDGPFAYPFYCKNGMEVKRTLAEAGIYVPTLWPNVLESKDMLARDYAENILPLPCDQRYGTEDMQIVANAVLKCV